MISAELGGSKAAATLLIIQSRQGRGPGVETVVSPIQKPARNLVVPVGEYIRLDEQRITHHAFNGESAAINFGPDVLNDGPAPSLDPRFGRAHPLVSSSPA